MFINSVFFKKFKNSNISPLFLSFSPSQAMELEAAYEALADYSLQEAPFYEAPLKAPVPATEADQQNPLLSFRSALFSAQFQRDIMAASSLMLPANSGATGGKGMQLNGGMQSALVPALASSTGKPKKNMKKSVSFLPTFVQVSAAVVEPFLPRLIPYAERVVVSIIYIFMVTIEIVIDCRRAGDWTQDMINTWSSFSLFWLPQVTTPNR